MVVLDSDRGGFGLCLSGGVDVELALQDVVDDGLIQVIHNMAVSVLKGQSEGEMVLIQIILHNMLSTFSSNFYSVFSRK